MVSWETRTGRSRDVEHANLSSLSPDVPQAGAAGSSAARTQREVSPCILQSLPTLGVYPCAWPAGSAPGCLPSSRVSHGTAAWDRCQGSSQRDLEPCLGRHTLIHGRLDPSCASPCCGESWLTLFSVRFGKWRWVGENLCSRRKARFVWSKKARDGPGSPASSRKSHGMITLGGMAGGGEAGNSQRGVRVLENDCFL